MEVFVWENRKLGESLLKFFENIGNFVFIYIAYIVNFYKFSVICFLNIFNPKSYNPASRKILIEQIFYTSLEILPIFIFLAMIFGVVFMGFVVDLSVKYSMQDYLSNIIVKFIVVEFVPFFMALYISLRTGLRVGIKTSIMNVNSEFKTLDAYKIDIVNYLFTPRVVAGMISFLSLAILFSVIMVLSGYIFIFFSINMDFTRFITSLTEVVTIKDILIFVLKSLFFGFLIIVIPSFAGVKIKARYIEIPVAMSKAMVGLFASIFLMEVISLSVQLI